MKKVDVAIIGKGPAGVSCALYTRRAGFDTLILGKDFGSLSTAEKIENYYGLSRPLSGLELAKTGVAQAQALGVQVEEAEVLALEKEESFLLSTENETYWAKAVLLATGKKRSSLKVKDLDAYVGRGVSFCAVCDSFFYRKKPLALLGNSRYTLHEYEELRHFTDQITVCTNGRELAADGFPEGLPVRKEKLLAAQGDGRIQRLVFESGPALEIDGVFVAEGTASALDFAAKIGVAVENGSVLTDENRMTNLPGLFAAGDCTGGLLQVSTAVADGALAAQGIISYLRRL